VRELLLVLVGASVGLSLVAAALHIVALIRTHDWRGQLGYILSKLGWALVMLPILQALNAQSHVATTGLTEIFALGVALGSIGFAGVALDVNRANRVLAASGAAKVGLEAVEQTIAEAEKEGE
jgi:hypothetical protein